VIDHELESMGATESSCTWVLSNHDVVRHATRYGLPLGGEDDDAVVISWLRSRGAAPRLDAERGLRRARAATLLMLALPGSSYLYQGEELGLPEVATIPDAARQDPVFFRSNGERVGRDGCRVPLPWVASATGASHLPQPEWWDAFAVDVEAADPGSTLNLYRSALALRRDLQRAESLTWVETASPGVLAFVRPGGWLSVTNFGSEPAPLPLGEVLLASEPGTDGQLPPDTTAWLHG
jgi:alpha-glucosidase